MPRAPSHPVVTQPESRPPASVTWADWPWRLQAFQVHAARDMLGVFNRYVGALVGAREIQAVTEAQRTVVADWMACIEGVHKEWVELARAVPPEAWTAYGWRLKPAALAPAGTKGSEGSPDLSEQPKLALEMLLRPWLPAADLEHTDEFVA